MGIPSASLRAGFAHEWVPKRDLSRLGSQYHGRPGRDPEIGFVFLGPLVDQVRHNFFSQEHLHVVPLAEKLGSFRTIGPPTGY